MVYTIIPWKTEAGAGKQLWEVSCLLITRLSPVCGSRCGVVGRDVSCEDGWLLGCTATSKLSRYDEKKNVCVASIKNLVHLVSAEEMFDGRSLCFEFGQGKLLGQMECWVVRVL